MTARPTAQQRWPINQERRRTEAIDLAKSSLVLLNEARQKLDNRDHPALVALDIADAMRYVGTIILLMTEAKMGLNAPEQTSDE